MTKHLSRTLLALLATLIFTIVQGGVARAQGAGDRDPAALGAAVAKAFNQRDAATLKRLMDGTAFAERVADSMGETGSQRDGFIRGFMSKGPDKLLQTYLGSLEQQKGTVKFIRVVLRGTEARPLLRVDVAGGGFDYWEMMLKQGADGPRIVDWDQLSLGGSVSTSVGALAQMLTDPNPGLLKSLFKLKAVNEDLVAKFQEMSKAAGAGRFKEAIDTIDTMPPEIGNSRTMALRRVAWSGMLNDEAAYRGALKRLARTHADDPAAAFLLIDHYFYEKDFERVQRSLAAVESRYGVDAMTRLLRANTCVQQGQHEKALDYARESMRLEPELEDNRWVIANASIALRKHADAVQVFKELASRFGITFSRADFSAKPEYADFVKSREFKAWLAR